MEVIQDHHHRDQLYNPSQSWHWNQTNLDFSSHSFCQCPACVRSYSQLSRFLLPFLKPRGWGWKLAMTCVVPWWEGPGKVILWGWSQYSRRPAGVEPAQFYGCLVFIYLFFWCGSCWKPLLSVLQYYLCYMLVFWPQDMWDLSFLIRDWKPAPLSLEGEVLTTGPPGKSCYLSLKIIFLYFINIFF